MQNKNFKSFLFSQLSENIKKELIKMNPELEFMAKRVGENFLIELSDEDINLLENIDKKISETEINTNSTFDILEKGLSILGIQSNDPIISSFKSFLKSNQDTSVNSNEQDKKSEPIKPKTSNVDLDKTVDERNSIFTTSPKISNLSIQADKPYHLNEINDNLYIYIPLLGESKIDVDSNEGGLSFLIITDVKIEKKQNLPTPDLIKFSNKIDISIDNVHQYDLNNLEFNKYNNLLIIKLTKLKTSTHFKRII